MKINFTSYKGFSLVELSVVLVIISITLGTALSIATKKAESEHLETTKERIAAIELALARFLSENYRLPCPANIQLAIDNASFGLEQINGKSGLPDPAVCTSNYNSGIIWGGAVPTKTLELPDEYMFDGYDRRFLYVVDNNFINNFSDVASGTNANCDDVINSNCFQYTDAGSISVYNSAASGSQPTTEAVYVILSFGKNGHGAYTKEGGTSPINAGSTHPDEIENAESGGSFDSLFIQDQEQQNYLGDSKADYDDITDYKLKWQIIDEAKGITTYSICTLANDVFDNHSPATNLTCSGATSETTCQSFADQLYYWCYDQ